MKLTKPVLTKILRAVEVVRPNEIDCEECFEQLDQFAEQVLDGRSAKEAMPLVKDHLERCRCCREEFEALLEILREVS